MLRTNRLRTYAALPSVIALLAGCADAPTGAVAIPRAVASVAVAPADLSLQVGASAAVAAVPHDSNGTPVQGFTITWASSDTAVATVSSGGLVSARGAGTATIRATAAGKIGSIAVTVSAPPVVDREVARVETDSAALALGVGESRTIVARALDVNGQPLTRTFAWSTSNGAVVSVDPAGKVVATGAGTALVTVSSEGRQATVLVTVTGQQWQLTRAGDAPLPAVLFTTTMMVDGVVREAVVQVTGGTLRMRNGRYELRLYGWAIAAGAAPVATTLSSDGVMAYDMTSGAPMFHEGDEWFDRQPRFRGRFLSDGRLEIGWNPAPDAPLVPLVFAQ